MQGVELQYFTRFFDEERDYKPLCEWWAERGLKPVLPVFFPKTSIVACEEENGDAVAFACLFMDNSRPVAFVEWSTSKPGMSFGETRRALDAVYSMMEICAKELGYFIFYTVCHKTMARASRSLGWSVVHDDMVIISKEVN